MDPKETILEYATLLGDAIKGTEEIARLSAAQQAYQSDEELKAKITEYQVQTAAMTEEYKKPEKDYEVIRAIEERVNSLYQEISGLPVMIEYQAAQEAVNELMNLVNNQIQFRITGERPSSCTHNCETCGGCR
ncbi:MAG: YlbF family regulator [Clostridia bacterium]|nr:YlbF family regulator [Clostridia bacterium]MBO4797586.1 YlbF family regulator [Candidatus Methanomethylophilaceae archaeon]MBQ4290372.1 YlbF family regulator [Clostridia bacterium]